MRWMMPAAAALAASCAALPLRPAAAPAGADGGGASGAGAAERMAALVNAHRRSVRCRELVWMPAVAAAAQAHSDDMARRRYLSHQSPEGMGPAERLRAHGVGYRALAENIAQHPGAPRDVLAGWLASPGHRQNLERCAYTHHGIGVRGGYWTHVFVTPLAPPAGP